jgi:hypothetical protein
LAAKSLIETVSHIGSEKNIRSLIDSATYVNLLSAILVKKCDLDMIPLPEMLLNAANGTSMTLYGTVTTTVTVLDSKGHKLTTDVTFVVSDLEGYDIYYGMPFLEKHNPTLNFYEKKVYWQGTEDPEHPSFTNIALETEDQFRKTVEDPTTVAYVCFVNILTPEDRLGSQRDKKGPLIAAVQPGSSKSGPQGQIGPGGEYNDFADIMSEKEALGLPEHGHQDLPIDLEPGTEPPYFPLHGMSEVELAHLRKYIAEYLQRGWIRRSRSPAGAPILFAKKKDGTLRLCVDYRGLNKVTVKDRGPLPLISDSLDRLSRARIFTKIDVRDAYHRIRIRRGDEWKTAFRTRYGHFEYLVMPFGLTNAPARFQAYINQALAGLVDVCCIVYLDDILIFSDTEEQHKSHVRQVLRRLRDSKLFVKESKCEFHKEETEFLGFLITPKGVKADPARIATIQDWPLPKTVRDIRVFLGFVNYYRRFICDFSRIVLPLTRLTQKAPDSAKGGRAQRREESVRLNLGDQPREAFQTLKKAFLEVPILTHWDTDRPTRVETDASKGAIAGILSQLVLNEEIGKSQWRPVDFFSQKLSGSSLNYDTHDRELLAVIRSLEHWEKYLRGVPKPFDLYTDHNNLRYFQTTKQLTERQCRWSEYLQRYNLVIQYRPGKVNPADAPSRRPDYMENLQGDITDYNRENLEHLRNILHLKGEQANQMVAAVHTRTGAGALDSSDEEHVESTPLTPRRPRKEPKGLKKQRIHIAEPDSPSLAQPGPIVARRQPRLIKSLTTVEQKAEALEECHDSPLGGHFGYKKTLYKIKRKYKWDGMDKDVSRYVNDCLLCRRSKAPKHAPYGLLNPLPPPDGPWQDVTLDFITELPPCRWLGRVYDSILVIVDRLTKMCHYVPVWGKITATELAEVWIREVFRLHGTPRSIISDRGPQMNSKYWNTFCHWLNTKRVMSSAYHPQTDGQTERQNQTLEQYLRCYCCLEQDDWVLWLSIAEFAYNDSAHAVTGYTPFECNTGVGPQGANWPGAPLDDGEAPLAKGVAAKVQELLAECKRKLLAANVYQKKYADKRRLHADFKVGSKVLISTRHMRSMRPKKKLDWKFIGPGTIVAQYGPSSFKVDYPALKKVHPVFHASLLELYEPTGAIEHPAHPIVDTLQSMGDESYEVDEILDRRKNAVGMWEYLVKWNNHPTEEQSWEVSPAIPAKVLNRFWMKKGVTKKATNLVDRGRSTQEGGIPVTTSQNGPELPTFKPTRPVRFAPPATVQNPPQKRKR